MILVHIQLGAGILLKVTQPPRLGGLPDLVLFIQITPQRKTFLLSTSSITFSIDTCKFCLALRRFLWAGIKNVPRKVARSHLHQVSEGWPGFPCPHGGHPTARQSDPWGSCWCLSERVFKGKMPQRHRAVRKKVWYTAL